MKTVIIFSILLHLILCSGAFGDDTAIDRVGGSIQIMTDHPSVHLVAEHIQARIFRDYVEVECVFFLRNDGPPVSVATGFPNFSSMSKGPFKSFESYVNGEKVEVEMHQENNIESDTEYWWIKVLDFEENEVKVVMDRYQGGINFDSVGNFWFSYVLYTGASWAGKIGAVSAVVSLEDFSLDEVVKISPPGYVKDGSEIRWAFTDLEPTEDGSYAYLHVGWKNTPATRIKSEFHRLAASGAIEDLSRLLKSSVTAIDSLGDYKSTPLQLAIRYGAGPETVDLLLKNGANPNGFKGDWNAPLHTAVWAAVWHNYQCSAEIVELLIKYGADVNQGVGGFANGQTALDIAIQNHAPEDVVNMLKKHGAVESD